MGSLFCPQALAPTSAAHSEVQSCARGHCPSRAVSLFPGGAGSNSSLGIHVSGGVWDFLFNSAQHCARHQLIDRFSVKPGSSRRQGRQVGSGRGDLKVGFTDIPTPVNPHWHARGLETWMKAELALFITPSVGT